MKAVEKWEEWTISIHALREEGDTIWKPPISHWTNFYPRPPRGGRPSTRWNWTARATYFYPRPPRGGRPGLLADLKLRRHISIHALREEGDYLRQTFFARLAYFYPRPPRGGRQLYFHTDILPSVISIHALREEGDPPRHSFAACSTNFYPRPPRGGRPAGLLGQRRHRHISIHALREEGDSKNGEKHLRFCFIIKRSAQIWKSLSKNIRKNSCNLHRTA